ncbi:MAG: glycosyltransferase family 2 protein, partial [Pseudomonadota bacterium]
DRFLGLTRAPTAGYDSALVYLENGRVSPSEVWRWHSLIGHDLFLLWCFSGAGLSTEQILPDTSDALKSFRVWAFAVGGQHQLSRPGTERVTGTDYQSGRVLQSFGARSVLGASQAHSETEIDRLAKMIRNFANEQSVFYGNTRSGSLERASGLYLHMSRIQDQIEAEVKNYSEELYEGIVFPERVLFPLRWMLQNYICAYFEADEEQRPEVLANSLDIIFGPQTTKLICDEVLTASEAADMATRNFEAIKARAEELAETIIQDHWKTLMRFYEATLRDFFTQENVSPQVFEPLLRPLAGCRNALLEERPLIDVNEVWSPDRFNIDYGRGQVLEVEQV